MIDSEYYTYRQEIPFEDLNIAPPAKEVDALLLSTFRFNKCTKEEKYYEQINIITPLGEYLLMNKARPCSICGKPAKLVEICYEGVFCNDECLKVMEDKFNEWCESHPMEETND